VTLLEAPAYTISRKKPPNSALGLMVMKGEVRWESGEARWESVNPQWERWQVWWGRR
jgi:hypothetical protein